MTWPGVARAVDLARLVLRFGQAHRATLLVARFALVHDLVEAYAGDTNTARGLNDAARAAKAKREAEALKQVRQDLGGFPGLVELLDAYEEQKVPEARWVRYVDKLTPKLTDLLNRGLALQRISMTPAEVRESHSRQGQQLRARYPDLPDLHEVFEEVCGVAEDALQHAQDRREL